MRTLIYLEGERLDLSDDVLVQLNFTVDEIRDFASRTTSYSRTITFPGTATNNKIFGHVYDIAMANDYSALLDNVDANFNPLKKADVEVYRDGLLIISGTLQLQSCTVTGGVVEFDTNIVGQLGGLVAAIGGKFLTDLDFSAYNHAYVEGSVTGSWASTPGTGYYYGSVDYGYTTNGLDLDIKGMRPALHVREYLDKIIKGAGYTWSSTFMDSASFKRLIVPANGDKLTGTVMALLNSSKTSPQAVASGTTAITYSSHAISAYFSGATGTSSSFTFTGDTGGVTAIATVTGTAVGTYTKPSGANVTVTLTVTKGGVTIATQAVTFVGAAGSYTINLTATASSGFAGSEVIAASITCPTGSASLTAATIKVDGPVDIQVVYGGTVPMNSTIPKNIKQVDFLRSIVQMFNLMVTEDKDLANHVIITPNKDYYIVSGATDWSDKWDTSKPRTVKPALAVLGARKFAFRYKSEDKNLYLKKYAEKFQTGYGDFIYDSGYQLSTEERAAEVVFSASPLLKYSGSSIVWSAMFTSNDDGVTHTPYGSNIRVLFRSAAALSCTTWRIKNGATTLTSPTTYGYAGHLDDPTTPTQDLLFGAPSAVYYDATAYPVGNLFNLYWSDYIGEQAHKDCRVVSCWVRLNDADIAVLDFSRLISIDGKWYRLNKVTDYVAGGLDATKVELVTVVNLY
jgi:hypothetical protein